MKTNIIIGVSSGIAAYKVIDLIKLLKGRGSEVYVIMTEKAAKMIDPSEFEKVSGHRVYTSLFPKNFDYKKVLEKRKVEHITLADTADLFVLAPATANTIAKIACGIADNFLTTTLLAATAPVLICPSMNSHMWFNSLVAENIKKLSKLGYYFLHPDSGALACGYTGVGRLADVNKIAQEISHILKYKNQLKGKKIIVTAGGTQEPIDTVRVITNRSSGKMGIALAQECFLRGADVLLLKSITAVDAVTRQDTSEVARRDSSDGGGIRRSVRSLLIETFETGQELSDLIKKHVRDYDIIFHVAAVSDYLVENIFDSKLNSRNKLTLRLRPAPKILHQIKTWNPNIKLIGFKAVYKKKEKDLIRIGKEKLKDSHSDYIIVNDVGQEGIGFFADANEVYIISPSGLLAKVDKTSKKEVARRILDFAI